MEKQRWKKLHESEVVRVVDYWLLFYLDMDQETDPKNGMKKDSRHLGRSVRDNKYKFQITGYNIWRCTDSDGPRRLPMNPIFSKPLPLP